jgi:hypothetical protein
LHWDAQLVQALAGHRHADQAAGVRGHEVDRVGRGELSGDDEVAFVLAPFVVGDDNELPGAVLLDGLFNRDQHAIALLLGLGLAASDRRHFQSLSAGRV